MHRIIFTVMLALMVSGCSAMYAQLTYEFINSDIDSRIYYEPGAEDLLILATQELQKLMKDIEIKEYVSFKEPQSIKVYVFNHRERYSKFANASIESIGSATTDEIYLSPKNRENIGTFPKILAHELSHIHLRQHIGTWQYVTDIPGWFHEGIAVISSNGGGAEKISKKQAAQSLNRGHHFIPIEIGSIFGHESAHEYGLKPQMFYRQAELFVRYLQQSDSHAFKNSYIGIIKGEKFSEVWKKHYGMNVTELWNQFLNEIKA